MKYSRVFGVQGCPLPHKLAKQVECAPLLYP